MDRLITAAGAIPLETDVLLPGRYAKAAAARSFEMVYGAGTVAAGGLAATPGGGLSVTVAAGSIIGPAALDNSAFGSLAADTTQVENQYLLTAAVTLSNFQAGVTTTIYAICSEVDDTPVLLPFYNSSNPAQTLAGANNGGSTANTRRSGKITLVASTSAPAPQPNGQVVALYVVAVPSGAASISASMIARAGGPGTGPFFPTIPQLVPTSAFTGDPGSKSGYRINPDGWIENYGFILKVGNNQPGAFQPLFAKPFTQFVAGVGATIANTTSATVNAAVQVIDLTKLGVYTTGDYSVFWWAKGF